MHFKLNIRFGWWLGRGYIEIFFRWNKKVLLWIYTGREPRSYLKHLFSIPSYIFETSGKLFILLTLTYQAKFKGCNRLQRCKDYKIIIWSELSVLLAVGFSFALCSNNRSKLYLTISIQTQIWSYCNIAQQQKIFLVRQPKNVQCLCCYWNI